MTRCLISFGANLGVPAVTIQQAVELLRQHLAGQLKSLKLSRLFRTPAVGGPSGQPPFVNAVAALEVESLTAWEMWHVVRQIEHTLGRVRQERWEARRIDLDVLLFGDQRIWTQHFKLPHPRMIMRRFILEPALDVARDWIEPVSGQSLQQLAQSLRSGPASIALVSFDRSADWPLLERAAEESQSQWLMPQVSPEASSAGIEPIGYRWLGLVPAGQLRASGQTLFIQPTPQLVIVLAPNIVKPGAAWEDIHRQLARWLQLSPASDQPQQLEAPVPDSTVWPVPGARYLLATDDRPWAIHEIVAAQEAMDCPVEAM